MACGRRASSRARQFALTKLTLAALHEHGLEPVLAQRTVRDSARRVATAIDLLCFRSSTSELVVVELKCGYAGDRTAAARTDGGAACCMRAPLSKVADSALHRHLVQLSATREMFVKEKDTLRRAQAMGVAPTVGGALLYVDDAMTELFELSSWWEKTAVKVLRAF